MHVVRVQGVNRQQSLLVRPTSGQLRSAAMGWEVRDAIALLALVIVYRTRLPTLRRLLTAATAVAISAIAYIRLHFR
jgi:hypothetical protein